MFSLQPIRREHCYWQPELDSATKSIKSRKNLLILGPEKIGKSSFLFCISKKLGQVKSFVPIIFSVERCIDIKSYIKKNLLSVLSAFPAIFPDPKGLFTLSMLDIDKRISGLKLSDNAKQSLKLLLIFEHDPKISIEDVVNSFFAFPSVLAAETKTTAVVMIDDADLLQSIKSDKASLSMLFGLLGSGDMQNDIQNDLKNDMKDKMKNVVFVLASSFRMKLGGFEELTLRPFSIDTTRKFLADHGLELDEPSLNTLYNFAGGVPFYINFFGRLIQYTGKTDPSSINQLINDSLSNELHIYFSERLKLLSPKELPILFCMAEHDVNSPSRISKLLNYSQTNVRRFLSIMEEKGFVTLKERGIFEIHDPVFRRWLELQFKNE